MTLGFLYHRVELTMTETSPSICLLVKGMMCQKNCGATVAAALKVVHGVKDVEVSFVKSAAFIKYNLDGVSLGHLVMCCIDAVEAVGFDCVRMEEVPPALILSVDGMMCNNSCTPTVYNAIMSASPSIVHATVSLEKGEACIWGKAGGEEIETSPQAIIDAIEISGFDAAVKEAIGHNKERKTSQDEALQDAPATLKKDEKSEEVVDAAAWAMRTAQMRTLHTPRYQ